MAAPQDWAPYSTLDQAARVYLRDPELALDQLRALVEFSVIRSFVMSRGASEDAWGEAVWQEILVTDGRRLIMWRADDELLTEPGEAPRRLLNASARTRQKSAVDTDLFCESFLFTKTVDDGGLAQMQRLLQFGRVLSQSM